MTDQDTMTQDREQASHEVYETRIREAIGPEGLEAGLAEGRRLPWKTAVDRAFILLET